MIAKGPNVMAGYFGDREATDAVIKDGWLHTGDLGRLDDEGKLYLVGRKKDVIIDANGKNVYPDELEELYGEHAARQGAVHRRAARRGRRREGRLPLRAGLQGPPARGGARELEEHFRKVSAELPFYRRVKVLRFWDGELPKTPRAR